MPTMDLYKIIDKYYDRNSQAYAILLEHGRMVTAKSLEIAGKMKYMNPDEVFIEEAAMLHDIGIFMANEPGIGCYGDKEYICHGYLGRELLEKEGFPEHGLVCERHVGVGLNVSDIKSRNLPLPIRDMLPVSLEEKIICYADKFFSKTAGRLRTEKPLEEVRRKILKFGQDKLDRFDEMTVLCNPKNAITARHIFRKTL
jgi:uncharacterized protein